MIPLAQKQLLKKSTVDKKNEQWNRCVDQDVFEKDEKSAIICE